MPEVGMYGPPAFRPAPSTAAVSAGNLAPPPAITLPPAMRGQIPMEPIPPYTYADEFVGNVTTPPVSATPQGVGQPPGGVGLAPGGQGVTLTPDILQRLLNRDLEETARMEGTEAGGMIVSKPKDEADLQRRKFFFTEILKRLSTDPDAQMALIKASLAIARPIDPRTGETVLQRFGEGLVVGQESYNTAKANQAATELETRKTETDIALSEARVRNLEADTKTKEASLDPNSVENQKRQIDLLNALATLEGKALDQALTRLNIQRGEIGKVLDGVKLSNALTDPIHLVGGYAAELAAADGKDWGKMSEGERLKYVGSAQHNFRTSYSEFTKYWDERVMPSVLGGMAQNAQLFGALGQGEGGAMSKLINPEASAQLRDSVYQALYGGEGTSAEAAGREITAEVLEKAEADNRIEKRGERWILKWEDGAESDITDMLDL